MTTYRFLEPLDVLYLRGNASFGSAGDHSTALMPPWPSLAAGALRARMLADAGRTEFGPRGGPFRPLPGPAGECLGTPDAPGSFQLGLFTLGRRTDAPEIVEPLFPFPADLVRFKDQLPAYLRPMPLAGEIKASYPLPCLPIMRHKEAQKPIKGLWLTGVGWSRYLKGEPIPREKEGFVASSDLWKIDPRLGIALNGDTRTVEKGQLYTSDTVALCKSVGFVVGVDGTDDTLVPSDNLLRFGGDGRSARIEPCNVALHEPPWDEIERTGRFRLVLASPGLFEGGWRAPGIDDHVLRLNGATARLVAAAVPRAEVISGWDIARWKPKPAMRAARTGSVYWFEGLTGGADALRRLADDGLPMTDTTRRAEGFNRVHVAAWATDSA
jgi:CRISPR-associated protein Cmr3